MEGSNSAQLSCAILLYIANIACRDACTRSTRSFPAGGRVLFVFSCIRTLPATGALLYF